MNTEIGPQSLHPDAVPQGVARRPAFRVVKRALIVAGVAILAFPVLLAVMMAQTWLKSVSIRASAGETVIRTLPDDTLATIGPASLLVHRREMRVLDESDQTTRDVIVHGEVEFDVPALPSGLRDTLMISKFTVTSPEVTLEGDGARFRVRVAPGETQVQVKQGAVTASAFLRGEIRVLRETLRAPVTAVFTPKGMQVLAGSRQP